MAAITSVEIENFRCFQKLRVDGLAQVNLIVGANNAGKTALLEAIEAVVSSDSPFALYRASFDRGEYRRRDGADEDLVELDLRHWFHGHVLAAGASFSIRAAGDQEEVVLRRLEPFPKIHLRNATFLGALFLAQTYPSTPRRNTRVESMPPLTADGLLDARPQSAFLTTSGCN